jgi:hypothetical protein
MLLAYLGVLSALRVVATSNDGVLPHVPLLRDPCQRAKQIAAWKMDEQVV